MVIKKYNLWQGGISVISVLAGKASISILIQLIYTYGTNFKYVDF